MSGRGRVVLLLVALAVPPVASGAPRPSEAAVTFDFRDADVADVFRVLGRVGEVPLFVGEDIARGGSLRLATVDWEGAVEAIAAAADLRVERRANAWHVRTLDTIADMADSEARVRAAREQAAPLSMRVLRLREADVSEVVTQLAPSEGAARNANLLSDRGVVFADVRNNTLYVADIPERVERIERVVDALDRLPRQVVIESEIVETSIDDGFALGVQWGYAGAFGGSADVPPAGGAIAGDGVGENRYGIPFVSGFPADVGAAAGSALDLSWGSADGSDRLAVRLSALERAGKARVVSRPRVVTLSNVPATIKSLTVIRVKLPTTDTVLQAEGSAGGFPSVATEKIETGIVLVVTPRVIDGARVVLDLFVKSSQADFSREVDGIPTETSREATTRLVVADGETVVLGGIYAEVADEREAGVPVLRSIPVLGRLFEGEQRSSRREDLLVFITPRIVDSVPDAMAFSDSTTADGFRAEP